MARERFFQHPDPDNHELVSEEEYWRLKAEREADKSSDKYGIEFHLKGNGFPSKRISMENKQRKALEKNPNHTTMEDYKFSNPNSVPSKALKRNKKKLRKDGVQIKKHGALHEPDEEKLIKE